MLKGRDNPVAREVGRARDELPVGQVQEGGSHLGAQWVSLIVGREERAPGHDSSHYDENGREQASNAARPEIWQADVSVDPDIAEQQSRNREPRKDEERVHSKKPCAEMGYTGVKN